MELKDKYLLTPKNTLLKVSTSAISTSAIGDLLFGLICLLTIFWLILSILFFYKSLRKYESNNFFGFGN